MPSQASAPRLCGGIWADPIVSDQTSDGVLELSVAPRTSESEVLRLG